MSNTTRICPICNQTECDIHHEFTVCPICGWEYDYVQEDNPDFEGGANDLSLNQYKERYHNTRK